VEVELVGLELQRQGQNYREDAAALGARGIEVLSEESMANRRRAVVAGSFDDGRKWTGKRRFYRWVKLLL
jgi:hypothetical protein